MDKEEKKKRLSSLKKMSYSHRPVNVKIKRVINLAKKNEENEILGLMGEFFLDNKRITVLFNPENILGYTDYYSLEELVGQEILARVLFPKTHNCVCAKQLKEFEDGMNSEKVKKEKLKVNSEKRNDMIKNFDKYLDTEFDAKIKSFNDFGAILIDADNIEYFLYDSCFAYGYIPIKKVKEVGDSLRVKLTKYREDKNSFYVTMVEKYQEEMTMQPEDFKPESIVKGTIVKKTSTLCFVNIAPMIDALCFPIEGFEVGTEVFVQIIGVKDLGNRKTVRGKIVLTRTDDEFKL